MRRAREELKAGEEITDEDREFMRQMAKRMPRLSLQNSPERKGRRSQTQLDGGYLPRLHEDDGG